MVHFRRVDFPTGSFAVFPILPEADAKHEEWLRRVAETPQRELTPEEQAAFDAEFEAKINRPLSPAEQLLRRIDERRY